jgi:hypothetical protein
MPEAWMPTWGIATISPPEWPESETSVGRALEAAGVEFIDENGGGPGVRLRKPEKEKSRK